MAILDHVTLGSNTYDIQDTTARTVTDYYNVTPYASHNGLYRGKMLVDTVGGTGAYTLAQLHALVVAGNFFDIYVGDIIRVSVNGKTTDLIAMAINWYIHMGEHEQTANHLVLVPREALGADKMNSTNTTGKSENASNTSGLQAYAGCDMRQLVLPTYLGYLQAALGADYILTQSWLLSNAMNPAVDSGFFNGDGGSSNWAWYDSKIELLNAQEVFGLETGNCFDDGICTRQLPGFKLNPDLIVKGIQADGRNWWWLSSVISATNFAAVNLNGVAHDWGAASYSFGVVPKILFG